MVFTSERISGNTHPLERRTMDGSGVLFVAEKKSKKEGKKSSLPASFGPGKGVAIQVRGSAEFKAWVEGLAEHDATDVSDVVERALANYARLINFTVARPKR